MTRSPSTILSEKQRAERSLFMRRTAQGVISRALLETQEADRADYLTFLLDECARGLSGRVGPLQASTRLASLQGQLAAKIPTARAMRMARAERALGGAK